MPRDRILVVDDERQILSFCGRVLESQGYQVRTLDTGRAAMACLERETFDLLLVDIKIPDVDGLRILRHGIAFQPNLTAVIITGYATLDTAIAAIKSGARGFVLKPFGIQELTAAIEEALAQARKEQERHMLLAQVPILEISHMFQAEGDVEVLAGPLLQAVVRQVPATWGALFLLDDQTRALRLVQSQGLLARERQLAPISVSGGLAAQILAHESAWLVDDWSQLGGDPLLEVWDGPATHVLGLVPLHARKKSVGLLALGRAEGTFSEAELLLLSIVGRQIAVALDNARLFDQVRRLNDFYGGLLRNMAEGMAISDAGGNITYLNPAGAALLGYRPEELVGQHWSILLPIDRQEIVHQVEERRRQGKSDRYEVTYLCRDGSLLPVLVAGRPLFDGQCYAGTQFVFSDLTEVKQLQAQLVQSEKLAATGRLAASLAHEINNPLQAIHNGLQILLNFSVAPEEQHEYLQIAGQEVERLIGMVGRILDFARRPDQNLATTDAGEILRAVVALSGKYLQHRDVALQLHLAADLPAVQAAPDELKQVFLNLLLNAVEAMPGGGSVAISTSATPDGHVSITFADTGVGVAPEVLDRIFEPFFSTKEGSSGLGLAVSHAVVRRHGGKIIVDSQVGRGTTVTVRLPIPLPESGDWHGELLGQEDPGAPEGEKG